MSKKRRILLVEDAPWILLTVVDRLSGEGYEVDTADNGDKGWEMAVKGSYDLVLLDIMLPGKDGLEICRDLRAAGNTVPVIMLTARSQIEDRVNGLRTGADDYLVKPFDLLELSARVDALFRRHEIDSLARETPDSPADIFIFGPFELDFIQKELRRDGVPVELSFQEYSLLVYLIQNRSKVVSREELLIGVWGYKGSPSTRTVDVHVAILRQKIETDSRRPQFIQTSRKRGYRFAM